MLSRGNEPTVNSSRRIYVKIGSGVTNVRRNFWLQTCNRKAEVVAVLSYRTRKRCIVDLGVYDINAIDCGVDCELFEAND